jgi:hypothetical protein
MKLVSSDFGTLRERPRWERPELERRAEVTTHSFLARRHGCVRFPFGTEDLHVLVEQSVKDFDAYHEFAGDERNVEGVTHFRPGARPIVQIARSLSETPRLEKRLRMTICA